MELLGRLSFTNLSENELHTIKEGKRSNGRKRWRLEEYLGGRQGKTAVYKASDTRLGYVALKFIAAHDEKVRHENGTKR